MKLASFRIQDRATWGVVDGRKVLDVGGALGDSCPDIKACLEQTNLETVRTASKSAAEYEMGEIAWLPVIPNPEKIFCVGLNYEMHRKVPA